MIKQWATNLDIERDYEKVYKAPNEPGKYNLFVDVINKDKSIQSYMTLIEVKKWFVIYKKAGFPPDESWP